MLADGSMLSSSAAGRTGPSPGSEPLPLAVFREERSGSVTSVVVGAWPIRFAASPVPVSSRSPPWALPASMLICPLPFRRGVRLPYPAMGSANASAVGTPGEDVREVVGNRLLELLVGAGPGVTVGPPAVELGGVPEAVTLHVLVPDLHDEIRPQRREREVLAVVPAAELGAARGAGAFLLLRPGPGVVVERRYEGLQLREELLPSGGGKGADHAHAGQGAIVLVQPEQEGADAVRTAFVDPVAGDHAVGGPLVLDLEHRPLVRLVGAVQRLRHHPVQTRALEL